MKKFVLNCNVLLSPWTEGQKLLPQVFRWGKYIEANPLLRKQSTLTHLWGISFAGSVILSEIKPYLLSNIDEALILRGITMHDYGEGRAGDTLWARKTKEKDLEEYYIFLEAIKGFSTYVQKELKEAFLLQFAKKNPVCFPACARKIMDDLWKNKTYEVLLFIGIETIDYVLYALESHAEHGDKMLLTHVLYNQVPVLRDLRESLPGWGMIWTEADEKKATQFIKRNRDLLPHKRPVAV